jgi:hypothetical protein
MELEGLKRALSYLEENAGLDLGCLVTDRHSMVKKYMKDTHPTKKHYFDVWHVAKGKHRHLTLSAPLLSHYCEEVKVIRGHQMTLTTQ